MMKMISVVAALALLDVTFASGNALSRAHQAPGAPPPSASQLPVEPTSLTKIDPVDLSTLIFDAMPIKGTKSFGWDHMLQAPVQWTTDGYSATPTGYLVRDGWARVRVDGRTTTVLKQAREELPWQVELNTKGNEKSGPQEITIVPGGFGDDQCLGSLYQNCNFLVTEALESMRFAAKFLCQVGQTPDYARYYLVSAPGRANLVAAYEYSEGAQTLSTWITLTLASNTVPYGLSAPRPRCAGGA